MSEHSDSTVRCAYIYHSVKEKLEFINFVKNCPLEDQNLATFELSTDDIAPPSAALCQIDKSEARVLDHHFCLPLNLLCYKRAYPSNVCNTRLAAVFYTTVCYVGGGEASVRNDDDKPPTLLLATPPYRRSPWAKRSAPSSGDCGTRTKSIAFSFWAWMVPAKRPSCTGCISVRSFRPCLRLGSTSRR